MTAQPTLDPLTSPNFVSGTLGTKTAGVVRVCVDDLELARAPVGAEGNFAVKLDGSLTENEQVGVQQVTSSPGVMPEKYGPVSKLSKVPPALVQSACVANPGAPGTAPTVNPVDPGSSVAVAGTWASSSSNSTKIQICVDDKPRVQATASGAGTFTAPPTAINSGDRITVQTYVAGPPATYGPLSAPVMAGKCSVVAGATPGKPTLDPLKAINLVSGTLSVKAADPVRVCIGDREVTRTVADANGNFAARLPQSLTTSQQATAQQITTALPNVLPETYGPLSNAVTLPPSQPNAECDITTPRPYLNTPAVEGIKHMVGCSEAGAAYTKIYVYSTGSAPACLTKGSPSSSPTLTSVSGTPDTNQRFAVDFVQASTSQKPYLVHGQWVCVLDFEQDGSVINTNSIPILVKTWDDTESSSPWGRVHLYVSGGVVFSQTNSQFSNEDLFVGLDVDSNWHRGRHTMLNSFFDAQMTSAPAAACATTSTATSTSTCQSSTSISTSTFITSQKAGVVQGGLYIPITSNAWRWSYGGHDNAFFLAPIFKAGVETLTSNTETISSPGGGTSASQTITGANVFPFYSIGFRLGQFGMPHSWNKAPYLLSFLDATIGKWYSFQQCDNSYCSYTSQTINNPNGSTTTVTPPVPNDMLFPLMIEFEGRMKVPKTPVLIGFDSYTPATHVANLHGDLRFLFGVRLDVGCIYTAFKGGNTPSITSCTEGTSTTSSPTPGTSSQTAPATGSSTGEQPNY